METNTSGEKINVVTSIVVKTFVRMPLAVTTVFCSALDKVSVKKVGQGENLEEISLALTASFDPDKDYLVAVTRSGEDGKDCRYTLLAGAAPDWFAHPERESFNLLGGSDRMEPGHRPIVALPLRFMASRLAHEKPRV